MLKDNYRRFICISLVFTDFQAIGLAALIIRPNKPLDKTYLVAMFGDTYAFCLSSYGRIRVKKRLFSDLQVCERSSPSI